MTKNNVFSGSVSAMGVISNNRVACPNQAVKTLIVDQVE